MVSYPSCSFPLQRTVFVLAFFIAGLLVSCASSASITWELIASRRRPAFSSHLLASTEDHAWERSPDTGRLKGSNPVQSVHWRSITRRCKGSETRESKSGSRRYQLTFDGYPLPYGCGSTGYNIRGFV